MSVCASGVMVLCVSVPHLYTSLRHRLCVSPCVCASREGGAEEGRGGASRLLVTVIVIPADILSSFSPSLPLTSSLHPLGPSQAVLGVEIC